MNDSVNSLPENPFDPQHPAPPFAGREHARQRVMQHVIDPVSQPVPAFIGRPGIGKSALLQQFAGTGPDYYGVYLPLRAWTTQDQVSLLRWIIDHTLDNLEQDGYVLNSLERPEATDFDTLQTWLIDDGMPAISRVIRRRRTLLFLFDDVDALREHIEPDEDRHDILERLHNLQQPGLGMAVTLDMDYEDDVTGFVPLVKPDNVMRLKNLTPSECYALLKSHLPIEETTSDAVHQATGGEPGLVRRFAYFLYERLPETPTEDSIQDIRATVYAESEPRFREIWHSCSRDERLVLTALSSLRYESPIGSIKPEQLERWLVETDFPLDETAINAALRSLEYRVLVHKDGNNITITAGLMHTWLLENARLDHTVGMAGTSQWRLIGIVVLIIVALGLILAITLSTAPSGTISATPIPTAELPMTP